MMVRRIVQMLKHSLHFIWLNGWMNLATAESMLLLLFKQVLCLCPKTKLQQEANTNLPQDD